MDHVSFCLGSGETLGIVGESGSGKSTVARMVAGLLEPSEGEIYLGGRGITRLKPREQRQVYRQLQMVFQSPAESFDPRRTLGDGVGESLKNRRPVFQGKKNPGREAFYAVRASGGLCRPLSP